MDCKRRDRTTKGFYVVPTWRSRVDASCALRAINPKPLALADFCKACNSICASASMFCFDRKFG